MKKKKKRKHNQLPKMPTQSSAVSEVNPRVPLALPARFTLAPLTKLDPALVLSDEKDPFSKLLLALALVFNDLKGLAVMRDALAPSRPGPLEVSAHAGEWNGLELQLYRYQVSSMHELFNLIVQSRDVVDGGPLGGLVAKMPAPARTAWRAIVAAARGEGDPRAKMFAGLLARIRNTVGFHYHNPKSLAGGFTHMFVGPGKHVGTADAYASLGKNMEQT